MAKQQLDMNSLKPNSHAYKEGLQREKMEKSTETDHKKLAPVVQKDGVVSTKKPFGAKFKDAFISADAQDVKSYVLLDIIIQTIKNTMIDVLEMFLFNDTGGRSRRGRSRGNRDQVSYSSYYKSEYNGRSSSSRDRRDHDDRYEKNDKVDYRNIVLRDRRDAEEVVNELKHRIDSYRQATVADLLDLIDVTSNYVDNNWGWTDVRDIGIRRVSSGYLIDVAEAEHLD